MDVHIDKTFIFIGIIVFLSFRAFRYWLCWGAIVSYMAAKDYPLPDDLTEWGAWYLKKSLGLKADLPDRNGT